MSATRIEAMIKALLTERDGYVLRGMTERVAQVDEQLAALGHPLAPETTATSGGPERAVRKPARRRG